MRRGAITLGPADYTRVIELWKRTGLGSLKLSGRDSETEFRRQIARDRTTVLGVENDAGNLVGVVVATHDGRKGWINRLAVAPEERRRGLGKILLAAAEEALRAEGMKVIAALIEPQNDSSLEFFLTEGYSEFRGMHYLTKRDGPDV